MNSSSTALRLEPWKVGKAASQVRSHGWRWERRYHVETDLPKGLRYE